MERLTVWFVEGESLAPVQTSTDRPISPQRAIAILTAGPPQSERGASLRTAIPEPAMIESATSSGGTATVRLDPSFNEIPSGDQLLAIGQIVLTLTNLRGIGQVRFVHGDEPVPIPLPTGDSTAEPVSADDFSNLASRT